VLALCLFAWPHPLAFAAEGAVLVAWFLIRSGTAVLAVFRKAGRGPDARPGRGRPSPGSTVHLELRSCGSPGFRGGVAAWQLLLRAGQVDGVGGEVVVHANTPFPTRADSRRRETVRLVVEPLEGVPRD
jgi:hypothetical protein